MRALVIAAVALAWSARAAVAVCNTEDGNISDPNHAGINYELVLDGRVEVCNQSATLPDPLLDFSLAGWNAVPNFDFFQAECLPPPYAVGVLVQDATLAWCGGKVACADLPSNQQVRQLLHFYVTPSFAGLVEGEKKHGAGHELGHTLGFWHNVTCPAIMGPCDWESSQTPQAFDIANYFAAYSVEAVTGLQSFESHGTGGDVALTWEQVNADGEVLCNEAGFVVHRSPPVVGTFDTLVDELPKDDQASIQLNQGEWSDWCYRVTGWTAALANQGGHAYVGIDSGPHSQDSDCDAWADVWEEWIGTDAEDACGASAWPPDMDGNGYVQVSDVLVYKGKIMHGYWQRLDILPDNVINVVDILQYRGLMNKQC